MTSDGAGAVDGTAGGAGGLSFDTTKAHQARVYDYLLGGKNNYAADREVAAEVVKLWPEVGFTARANRAFVGRAVRFLAAEAGVRQFLDLGTGIPAEGNVHEVAQAVAPESRVVYVDYDPVVLAHARALLDSSDAGTTEYIDADLRDTGTILARAGEVLDFAKPVAVTVVSILHVVPDADDPWAIVGAFMDAVPSGSYLAVSHAGADLLDREMVQRLTDTWNSGAQQRMSWRSREQIARFFTGTDLVEPGLVPVDAWRPVPGVTEGGGSAWWGGVGRKR
jgi:hypothetical protein